MLKNAVVVDESEIPKGIPIATKMYGSIFFAKNEAISQPNKHSEPKRKTQSISCNTYNWLLNMYLTDETS